MTHEEIRCGGTYRFESPTVVIAEGPAVVVGPNAAAEVGRDFVPELIERPRPRAVGALCGMSQVVLASRPAKARYCYGCRKRHAGRFELVADDELGYGDPSYRGNTLVEDMSHYDPAWRRRCDGCGGDHAAFPGQVIHWGADSE